MVSSRGRLFAFGFATLGVCLVGLVPCATWLSAQDLEVHFINLGHGDCSLIKTPEGKVILLDAGLAIMNWKLRRYLRDHQLDTIDLLILSHPHQDHYGGMRGIVKELEVKAFVEPGVPSSDKAFSKLLRLVQKKGVPHTIARRGKTLRMGEVALHVLSPPKELLEGVRSVGNANSIVLRLSYEDIDLLFTGDIEVETEELLLQAGDDLRADLLKVPHHGISTSTTAAFLEAVRPRYAVIQCAYYAEPSRDLYDRFQKRGITWFRNDANGTVVFRFDRTSGEFVVDLERGEENPRLKVAPDWYKLLQQGRSVSRKARDTWKKKVYQRAKRLTDKIRKDYERKKEEWIQRLPGSLQRRLRKEPSSTAQPVP